MSKPKGSGVELGDMFQPELEALLDQRQGLYKLANALAWDEFFDEVPFPIKMLVEGGLL